MMPFAIVQFYDRLHEELGHTPKTLEDACARQIEGILVSDAQGMVFHLEEGSRNDLATVAKLKLGPRAAQ